MKKIHKFIGAAAFSATAILPINAFAASTTTTATTTASTSATTSSTTEATAVIPFADQNTAAPWAQPFMTKAKALGLVQGDKTNHYYPKKNITRQEAAVILSNLFKLNVTSVTTSSFKDVTKKNWGINYIQAVKEAGLMVGDKGGTFRPNDNISRQELAVILVRATGKDVAGKGSDLKVADKASVAPWAADYVEEAIELKVIQGDGTNFRPKNFATRQEIAVMFVQLEDVLHADSQTPGTTTGDTINVTTGDSVNVTTGDTVNVSTPDSLNVTTGDTVNVSSPDSVNVVTK